MNAPFLMVIQCPYCKRKQKYIPRKNNKKQASFVGKRRKCIKCGRSFLIYEDRMNNNVIEFNTKNEPIKHKQTPHFQEINLR